MRSHFVRFSKTLIALIVVCSAGASVSQVIADDAIRAATTQKSHLIWTGLAPGETVTMLGTPLAVKGAENPAITRVEKIRTPSLDVFAPSNPNGTAVIILPGGGFRVVVPDLEGSEAAVFLNRLGITVFVLNYRTNEVTPADEPNFLRPLQDAQRAIRWVRANAANWKLKPDHVGVLGFSAGGQVASVLHTASDKAAYEPIDDVDKLSFRPDFTLLIYPWNVLVTGTDNLMTELQFRKELPPAFIVHTSDDHSSAIGAAMIYAGLKKHGVPAELHIYENGGHGYGVRAMPHSNIGSWTDRATDWLVRRGLGMPTN